VEIVEKYKVTRDVLAPTAVRVLKKQDPAFLKKYDLSSLQAPVPGRRAAGRDHRHQWIMDALGIPVIDNYWQTETGWPMLSICRGVEDSPIKLGSPGFPVYGYDLRIFREDGTECGPTRRASSASCRRCRRAACPPCGATTSASSAPTSRCSPEPVVYSSFDWGIKDDNGYYTILGRTDDVINVAGHRLGTREIEEAVQTHPAIAEVAVVGVPTSSRARCRWPSRWSRTPARSTPPRSAPRSRRKS
jgi:propionyl-CoA synthetase